MSQPHTRRQGARARAPSEPRASASDPLRRLATQDLNLLLVLSVLLEEESVTAAARRLGLTQSAVSHKLARLRALLGDKLLVRARGGAAEPTTRARALREPLRELVQQVDRVLGAPPPFDPARAARAFVLASTDYCEFMLLSGLMAGLRADAPGVDLVVRQLSAQPERWLAAGEIDLALGTMVADAPGVMRRRLFSDRFVCLLRRDHPAAKRGALTLDAYLALPHALVAPRGVRRGRVDDELARRGLGRRVVLFVPDFFAVARVIAETDLVLTIPAGIAESLAAMLPVRLLPPPLPLAPFDTHVAWHERQDRDPALVWLRAQLQRAAAARASEG
jgi:DNA-binding transcriptional LysR family regulator